MIATTFVVMSGLLSIAIFKLVPPTLLLRPAKRMPLIILAAMAPVAGLVLMAFQFGYLSDFMERRQWPICDGVVVRSEIVGKRARHPIIGYEFVVDGKPYAAESDLQAPGFGLRSNREEVAQAIIHALPIGALVRVYYDPQNPATAVLKPGAKWDVFARLSCGFLMYFVGIYAFLTVFLLSGTEPAPDVSNRVQTPEA